MDFAGPAIDLLFCLCFRHRRISCHSSGRKCFCEDETLSASGSDKKNCLLESVTP